MMTRLIQLLERLTKGYLCNFLKVFVAFLQCSGSVEGLAHTCVFAEESLAMVFNPVQHLRTQTTQPQPGRR